MILNNGKIEPLVYINITNALTSKRKSIDKEIYELLKAVFYNINTSIPEQKQINSWFVLIINVLENHVSKDPFLKFIFGLSHYFLYLDSQAIEILSKIQNLDQKFIPIKDYIVNQAFKRNSSYQFIASTSILFSRGFYEFESHENEIFIKASLNEKNINFSSSQSIELYNSLKFEISSYENFFIIGHGSNERGLKYWTDYNQNSFIYKEIIQNVNKKPKVLGLFSCAINPYLNILNNSEYFIIPNENDANLNAYARFIYGFTMSNKSIDCIKQGIIATMLLSNDDTPLLVFKNGKQIFPI